MISQLGLASDNSSKEVHEELTRSHFQEIPERSDQASDTNKRSRPNDPTTSRFKMIPAVKLPNQRYTRSGASSPFVEQSTPKSESIRPVPGTFSHNVEPNMTTKLIHRTVSNRSCISASRSIMVGTHSNSTSPSTSPCHARPVHIDTDPQNGPLDCSSQVDQGTIDEEMSSNRADRMPIASVQELHAIQDLLASNPTKNMPNQTQLKIFRTSINERIDKAVYTLLRESETDSTRYTDVFDFMGDTSEPSKFLTLCKYMYGQDSRDELLKTMTMGESNSVPPLAISVRAFIAAALSNWVLDGRFSPLPPRVEDQDYGTLGEELSERLYLLLGCKPLSAGLMRGRNPNHLRPFAPTCALQVHQVPSAAREAHGGIGIQSGRHS